MDSVLILLFSYLVKCCLLLGPYHSDLNCSSFIPKETFFFQRTLEREVRGCQVLIIWTDCDREGENIGFEVIDVCQSSMFCVM